MIKTFLTPEEINRMVSVAPTTRDKLIISFLADTGCRVSEFLGIKVEDIDLNRGEVLITHLKVGLRKVCPSCNRKAGRSQKFCSRCGGDLSKTSSEGVDKRTRLITVGKNTLQLLQNYIVTEGLVSGPIVNLTRQMVHYIVRQAAENAGLGGKTILNPETGKYHFVHPHSFRDSLAVDWLGMAGENITEQKALQEHLGHKRFDTTMRYHKLTPQTVRNVGNKVREKRFGQ